MRSFVPRGRAAGFVLITVTYVAALIAALITFRLVDGGLWYRIGAADLVATGVVFVFSVLLDNSSAYDPYWSVAPLPVVVYLAWVGDGPLVRRIAVVALVAAWGLRLTWNWARGWPGLEHEDWRYVDYRKKTGAAYWLVSALGLHLFPTATVFFALLALEPALMGRAPLGPWDVLALAVTAGAIVLETVADEQLRAFRRQRGSGGGDAIMATGVWAHSRHPNYLGEISFWWGLFLFGVAGGGWLWWTLPGPAWVTGMFVLFSVPLLDRRSVARRPAYADHMRAVPGLLPRPWRTRSRSARAA
jgi:steroid 5-alpha reductase family enzyme